MTKEELKLKTLDELKEILGDVKVEGKMTKSNIIDAILKKDEATDESTEPIEAVKPETKSVTVKVIKAYYDTLAKRVFEFGVVFSTSAERAEVLINAGVVAILEEEE